MKLIILSSSFYDRYKDCEEILKKESRPYYCVSVKVDGHLFAIPLRHHIRHAYAFFTIENAGLDFTKAVLVDEPSFITDEKPIIDSAEWNIIRGGEDTIFKNFRRYLRQYKRAMANPNNPRSIRIMQYSALQYFDL